MFEQHTLETVINFEFYLIHLSISVYISLFILCIGIIIILCNYICYLHCLDFVFLC